MTKIVCIAGFGDDATMFAPLIDAAAASSLQFCPLNLPGFGAPAIRVRETSLETLANYLNEQASNFGATIVLAHSVASIIASIATDKPLSPLKRILSLEGNLTPEDAYFSGTAASYSSPDDFRAAFLCRLEDMANNDPIVERYRAVVKRADPQALWELGCDAHRFSTEKSPGEVLQSAANCTYLFNSENLPESSRLWLEASQLQKLELPGASHWASLDQPHMLLDKIVCAIGV